MKIKMIKNKKTLQYIVLGILILGAFAFGRDSGMRVGGSASVFDSIYPPMVDDNGDPIYPPMLDENGDPIYPPSTELIYPPEDPIYPPLDGGEEPIYPPTDTVYPVMNADGVLVCPSL